MSTYLKYQIDYLERELKTKFSKKDIEFLFFYLMLSKKDQKEFIKIRNEVKDYDEKRNKRIQ